MRTLAWHRVQCHCPRTFLMSLSDWGWWNEPAMFCRVTLRSDLFSRVTVISFRWPLTTSTKHAEQSVPDRAERYVRPNALSSGNSATTATSGSAGFPSGAGAEASALLMTPYEGLRTGCDELGEGGKGTEAQYALETHIESETVEPNTGNQRRVGRRADALACHVSSRSLSAGPRDFDATRGSHGPRREGAGCGRAENADTTKTRPTSPAEYY